MMTITQEYQTEVWSQVVFIDPLPTRQPIPAPFLESAEVAIGQGFTVASIRHLVELRRGRVYIAQFTYYYEAVGCANALAGNLDCWDFETIPAVITRYNGVNYEMPQM